MNQIRLLFLCTLFLTSTANLLSQNIEETQSRTYGDYVNAIKVGRFPPACVSKNVCGPEVSRKLKGMRNPERPSVLVFCKHLRPDSKNLLRGLNKFCKQHSLPLVVTVTHEKGIAAKDEARFDPKHYLHSEDAEKLYETIKDAASSLKLDQASIGVAVNRFYRDKIGYDTQNDMIVSYVRAKVQSVTLVDTVGISTTKVHELIENLGRQHKPRK